METAAQIRRLSGHASRATTTKGPAPAEAAASSTSRAGEEVAVAALLAEVIARSVLADGGDLEDVAALAVSDHGTRIRGERES